MGLFCLCNFYWEICTFLGGNLFERLSDPMYTLTEGKCKLFIKQILEGLNFIHRHDIIHLNIIPYNIIFLNKVGIDWIIFFLQISPSKLFSYFNASQKDSVFC